MDPSSPESVHRTFFQVSRLHFNRAFSLLEPLGVYPGQPPLLAILDHEDGLSQKELASKLRIRPATVTVMLKRMEQSGWVLRRQDEQDQRITRVWLATEGRHIYKQVKAVMANLQDDCFGNLTEEEQVALQRLLSRVRENLLEKSGKDCSLDL